MERYDRIGFGYTATRIPDPRIGAAIRRALGDARSAANIGAGSGAYEPDDIRVVSLEPSEVMLAHRGNVRSLAIRAVAEALPLADNSVDGALAVSTLNHWSNPAGGLSEMRRVARRRVVIFMRDPAAGARFWLTERYLPALDETAEFYALRKAISRMFPAVQEIPVPLPADCTDGFLTAFWARPEAYLDPAVRQNMSPFALAGHRRVASGVEHLERDLENGTWDRDFGHLRSVPELDLGHRIFVAEF